MRGVLMVIWTILLVVLAGCSLAELGGHNNGSQSTNASDTTNSGNSSRDSSGSSNQRAGIAASARESGILDSLKDGGYVILLQCDVTNGSWKQDSQASQDSSGQNQPRRISDAFRKLSIPVGQVLYSTNPGTLEATAREFDGDRVEATDSLRLQDPSDLQRVDELDAGLQQLLSTPPSPGENTILISTIPNASSSEKAEAEATIFKPLGNYNFQRVAILVPEQWTELARDQ